MSTDCVLGFIKATRTFFPQGHPVRESADIISKLDNLRKCQSLQNIRTNLQYQLDEIASWQKLYPFADTFEYKKKLLCQLDECNKLIVQHQNKILWDEAHVSGIDKMRDEWSNMRFIFVD